MKVDYKKCHICRKSFFFPFNWDTYRYRKRVGTNFKYFCSWTCFRKEKRKNEI